MSGSGALNDHVRAIYGDTAAGRLVPTIEAVIRRWQSRLPKPRPVASGPLPLTRRDSLLITYADQVREHGFAPLRTLAEFCEKHLAGILSGVHVLPFYPSSSDDGFSVKDYYAVDPAFGSWDDVHRLGVRFDLMFDAVFNHMSAQGGWFARFASGDPAFRDFFVTVEGQPDLSRVIRPRALPLLTELPCSAGPRLVWTTFSADQVDLNVRNPEVLLALLDVLLFYVSQGARFIRLDAIAFLWKEHGTTCLHLPETHRVVQLMRTVLDAVAPGTMLITETNVPHSDNISYFGDGTNEAHLVYNFALPPLVLHAFATGDARKLAGWAAGLSLPSRSVCFFNFLASHDGIGINPARGILDEREIDALVARTLRHGGLISYKHVPGGEKAPYELNISFFDALSDPAGGEPVETQVARFVCAHGVQLALAGVPGIYFHSLFGSRGDRAGADASGIARRINRRKCTREELERDLRDHTSLRSRVLSGLTSLLRARSSCASFDPVGPQEVLPAAPGVFAVQRSAPDGREHVMCLHNVTGEPVDADVSLPTNANGRLRVLVGSPDSCVADGSRLRARLGAYEVLWVQLPEREG